MNKFAILNELMDKRLQKFGQVSDWANNILGLSMIPGSSVHLLPGIMRRNTTPEQNRFRWIEAEKARESARRQAGSGFGSQLWNRAVTVPIAGGLRNLNVGWNQMTGGLSDRVRANLGMDFAPPSAALKPREVPKPTGEVLREERKTRAAAPATTTTNQPSSIPPWVRGAQFRDPVDNAHYTPHSDRGWARGMQPGSTTAAGTAPAATTPAAAPTVNPGVRATAHQGVGRSVMPAGSLSDRAVKDYFSQRGIRYRTNEADKLASVVLTLKAAQMNPMEAAMNAAGQKAVDTWRANQVQSGKVAPQIMQATPRTESGVNAWKMNPRNASDLTTAEQSTGLKNLGSSVSTAASKVPSYLSAQSTQAAPALTNKSIDLASHRIGSSVTPGAGNVTPTTAAAQPTMPDRTVGRSFNMPAYQPGKDPSAMYNNVMNLQGPLGDKFRAGNYAPGFNANAPTSNKTINSPAPSAAKTTAAAKPTSVGYLSSTAKPSFNIGGQPNPFLQGPGRISMASALSKYAAKQDPSIAGDVTAAGAGGVGGSIGGSYLASKFAPGAVNADDAAAAAMQKLPSGEEGILAALRRLKTVSKFAIPSGIAGAALALLLKRKYGVEQ